MSKFFDELMESVQQMNGIIRGKREASRKRLVDALPTKEIRKPPGMAALIDIQLGTVQLEAKPLRTNRPGQCLAKSQKECRSDRALATRVKRDD